MHLDFLMGVRAIGRFLGDLKDNAIEGDGIVVGDRTLVFKAQSLFDLLGGGLFPDRLCLSGLGEFSVMLGQIALEQGLGLLRRFSFASLSSLTNRSWKVPHSLSILPLAWGEPAKIRVTPSSSRALPTSVTGR